MTTIPRPEHPIPYFQREHWLNLNGEWAFAFDPKAIGEQGRGFGLGGDKNLTITVPFPWESPLSGIGAIDYKGAAWYEREFTIPVEWADLVPYLNFGAIDWSARVWINGKFVAENDNGYLPFSIDLSPYVQPGETATVTVRAYDIADATTMVGKQVPFWYTHSSGIWQTVWLEGRAPTHIRNIRIEPDVENAQAIIKLNVHFADTSGYKFRVHSKNDDFDTIETYRDGIAGEMETSITVKIPSPKLWSPESPYLYEIELEVGRAAGGTVDHVSTYFGMRTVSRGPWNGNEYEYILLNGEPVYLAGALDQAFHPDGVHTYPTDDIIRGDIELAKDLGLNMLRCHIKINDPRYYYWADKLGLLIMYDMPCAVIDTPSTRRMFEAGMRRAIERDFNNPSIIAWVIFNETWGLTNHDTLEGQRWVQEMYQLGKALDPTRLVEDNSVCRYDHVDTDINSWHFYINDYDRVRDHVQRVVDETYPDSAFNYVGGEYVQSTAPLMNSEYGGIAATSGDRDIAWCFKYQTTELRRHAKICGYVYTELDDIEWEHNGFVNYDRSRKEFGYDFFVPDMSTVDLNARDLVGLDAPPCQTIAPGGQFVAPLFVSHWGTPMTNARVRWQLDFMNRFGDKRTTQNDTIAISPTRFHVTDIDTLHITLPNEPGLATVALWLEDDAGIRCRNYVNVEVRGDATTDAEQTASGWAIRFEPSQVSRTDYAWPVPFVDFSGGKFAAQGSGWVEYDIALPDTIDVNSIQQLRLRFEAAARAGTAKVAWKQRTHGLQYPQTEEQKFPSDLTVSINDTVVDQIQLPDDPADARGVLSHHRDVDPGSYGFLTELTVDGAALDALRPSLSESPLHIRFAILTNAENRGGFALYGDRLGCYPMKPTLFVDVG